MNYKYPETEIIVQSTGVACVEKYNKDSLSFAKEYLKIGDIVGIRHLRGWDEPRYELHYKDGNLISDVFTEEEMDIIVGNQLDDRMKEENNTSLINLKIKAEIDQESVNEIHREIEKLQDKLNNLKVNFRI